ncbi:MAG: type II/IV secretion system protein [Candidatus Doudnabacteria bacterium]|nr:type II/IV secretion system protein [Candidatus Doudnabacteria bacterium]
MQENKVETQLKLGANLSIINLVNDLVEEAHRLAASDIHIDPETDAVKVRFRVDGVLQDMHSMPRSILSEVITRIKIMSGLRTDEHQAALDGRFRTSVDERSIDVRVSIAPAYHGENAVLRLLSDQAQEFSLESLGFAEENRKKLLQAIHRPYGMILATGPTGSGKTTTLYTILKILNTREVSIITIEDPIEYSISGINQIQVNTRTGLTFAHGLRSILRQDPNIIMVGEIRDSETAGLAVNTALTGHLLLSTLHTNDAATTLPRLLDMKIEPYLIASTVNIALGQRLVRKICKDCKEELKITPTEYKSLSEVLPVGTLARHHVFWRGTGCDSCRNSGYKGRVGIHEVMVIDGPVREAVLQKAPATDIRTIAVAQGMTTMVEDGFAKAREGITTIEEVLRMLHE